MDKINISLATESIALNNNVDKDLAYITQLFNGFGDLESKIKEIIYNHPDFNKIILEEVKNEALINKFKIKDIVYLIFEDHIKFYMPVSDKLFYEKKLIDIIKIAGGNVRQMENCEFKPKNFEEWGRSRDCINNTEKIVRDLLGDFFCFPYNENNEFYVLGDLVQDCSYVIGERFIPFYFECKKAFYNKIMIEFTLNFKYTILGKTSEIEKMFGFEIISIDPDVYELMSGKRLNLTRDFEYDSII